MPVGSSDNKILEAVSVNVGHLPSGP
jgi:hypothetical protein